ncbi:LA_1612 family putative O-antigen biosynthesis protein [Leptospira mayottensis]|uniref:LA_1612 family putative O-antigen biosynthesis protein n=1 Tax=Leptospira mayottensis TaxID=1137606 RepID=UPI00345D5939
MWRFPKKGILLFYDYVGYDAFEGYISCYNPIVLHVRGEILNIPIFLLSVLKGSVSWQGYIDSFIRHVNPKLILTFIDNNPRFYKLKESHPDVITMFVQNGFRGEIGDVFGYLNPKENYNVDYMLTLGSDIGEKYSQYIKGEFVSIGSFKNNIILKKSRKSLKNNVILFISQYISPPKKNAEPFFLEPNGSKYYWEQFYEAEYLLLPFLKEYCFEKNLSIKVCGRSKKYDKNEFNFYKNFFEGLDWSMASHDTLTSSYELINSANLIVFIDSTLGYEALARGIKAAAFPIRCRSLKNESYKFGWPGYFSDNGPFWTNDQDPVVFKRILDHLTKISSEDWKHELQQSGFFKIMNFDPENLKFINLLRKIL